MGNRGLETRITEMIASGLTAEQIYLELLGEGLTVAEIQDAYSQNQRADSGTSLQQRVVRVVVTTGAILVGAGAFSFVASNWTAMSDPLRVFVIVAALTASTGAGWYVREYLGHRTTGTALLLLGSIIFGAGVFLCAQIFNVHGNWPDGFVLWMLGTLAMAFVTRSTPLYLLGIAVGIVAAAGYPLMFANTFDVAGGLDIYLLSSPLLIGGSAIVTVLLGLEIRRGLLGEREV
jgi:uncharacterized membrane protein